MYADVAYCYSVLCPSFCHSHKPCKTAELIEMPFDLGAQMGSRDHIIDGVQIAPCQGAIFMGQDMLDDTLP